MKSLSKLKKEVWIIFSQYIRTRDCFKTTGCASFGLCITCGKRYAFEDLQAGHFVPGRHNSNLFSEKGTHAQCRRCNLFLGGNLLEYRRQIIKLYGTGADMELEEEARQIRKFTRDELEQLKLNLREKLKELEQCQVFGN